MQCLEKGKGRRYGAENPKCQIQKQKPTATVFPHPKPTSLRLQLSTYTFPHHLCLVQFSNSFFNSSTSAPMTFLAFYLSLISSSIPIVIKIQNPDFSSGQSLWKFNWQHHSFIVKPNLDFFCCLSVSQWQLAAACRWGSFPFLYSF